MKVWILWLNDITCLGREAHRKYWAFLRPHSCKPLLHPPIWTQNASSPKDGWLPQTIGTLPETNIDIAPENGWLEYDPFFLGFGLFSGVNPLLVSAGARTPPLQRSTQLNQVIWWPTIQFHWWAKDPTKIWRRFSSSPSLYYLVHHGILNSWLMKQSPKMIGVIFHPVDNPNQPGFSFNVAHQGLFSPNQLGFFSPGDCRECFKVGVAISPMRTVVVKDLAVPMSWWRRWGGGSEEWEMMMMMMMMGDDDDYDDDGGRWWWGSLMS